MSPVPRPRCAPAAACLLVLVLLVLGACSTAPAPGREPAARPTSSSSSAGSTPSGAAARPSNEATPSPSSPTVLVKVYFVDRHGRLVARTLPVAADGDRFAEALALAASRPAGAGLEPAVPAGAFASVSFDGFGAHSQIGVTLADRSVLSAQPGMTPAEARLAVRAAVCTTQNGTDAPVQFYLGRRTVSRVLGQPLPGGSVRDGHCDG